jgi:hypothetical protein
VRPDGIPYTDVADAGAYYITEHDLAIGVIYGVGDRKKPAGGPDKWTRDPGKLAGWIEQHPDCGLFMALEPAGLWDVDLDVRYAGHWRETLPKLEEAIGAPLPETWTVVTPSGGEHRIFRAVRAPRFRRDLAKFVELKIKGTAPLPPSRHRLRDAHYRWKEGHAPWEIEAAQTPGEMIEFASTHSGNRAEALGDEPVGEGGRRRTLLSLGGTLRERGFGEETIVNQLLAFNESMCDPPLEDDEVMYLARDIAQRYPAGQRIPVLTFGHGGCGGPGSSAPVHQSLNHGALDLSKWGVA